jgi:DNA-binding MarR family transcriptional regulator
VTGLVGALVERRLVARRRNATDGRAQDLLLTARGRELATRAHRLSLTMESAMLQALSPAEQAMLGELLGKLARA